MSAQAFRDMLLNSLQDYALTRAEKGEVKEQLQRLSPNSQQTAELRNIAFELARTAASADSFPQVLTWLEDVLRLVHPAESESEAKTVTAKAFFSPHDNCPGEIRSLIAESRKTMDLCVFTITDDRLTSAVLDAHQRGVHVRILTDNDKAADLGSDADRFRDAGIELRVDHTSYHMHHKFAIFDSALLLNGSYNWTRSAAEHNEENFILTGQKVLIAAFQKQFETLWASLGPQE
jgi:cardiolipin hydrolase